MADENFKFYENDKVHQTGRKHCGKRRNSFQKTCIRDMVTQGFFRKGLIVVFYTLYKGLSLQQAVMVMASINAMEKKS